MNERPSVDADSLRPTSDARVFTAGSYILMWWSSLIPCNGGLSHNEAESANAPDLAAGANTLLHTLLQRAGHT